MFFCGGISLLFLWDCWMIRLPTVGLRSHIMDFNFGEKREVVLNQHFVSADAPSRCVIIWKEEVRSCGIGLQCKCSHVLTLSFKFQGVFVFFCRISFLSFMPLFPFYSGRNAKTNGRTRFYHWYKRETTSGNLTTYRVILWVFREEQSPRPL